MSESTENRDQEWPCPVRASAERHPDAPALVAPHRQYTYREYHEHARGAVVRLRGAGIQEGQVVAVALPPSAPYPIVLTGLWRLGAMACPLNTKFPSRYLLDILKRIRCRDIVVPYGTSIITVQGKLYSLAPKDLVEDPVPGLGEPLHVPADRPAAIVLTSGSAGTPKAALLSFGNLGHSAALSNRNIPLEPGDRWLMSLPLYHVSGLGVLFRCAAAGAAVVFPAADEALRDSVVKYEITHLSLVSTHLYRLLQDPVAVQRLRKLKAILLGGSAIPAGLIRQAHEAGLPIHTSYGLTEMATQVTTTPPGSPLDRLYTSGPPLDPDSVRLAEDGEILVRGPSRFLGYVSGSGLERPFTEDGWFATGDLGRWDAQGCLEVTGRRDNMFISGGENIHPEEIERCLREFEGVIEACVVPVGDPEFGQVPAAFVRLEAGRTLDESALREALAGQLPRHAVPKHWFAWPTEMADSGLKTERQELTRRARALRNGRT
jgi:O-succinylbenzoic acid--CoA ligase